MWRDQVADTLRVAAESAGFEVERADVRRAKRASVGWARADYTSALPRTLAARANLSPHEVARRLLGELDSVPNCIMSEENGFLNVRLSDTALRDGVARALREGDAFGASDALRGENINVEFVSADPTGPLSFEAARGAFGGESVCRLLELAGARVSREFFLNDDETSHKLRLLGESVGAFYAAMLENRKPTLPEGALRDAWVQNVGERIARNEGSAFATLPTGERALIFARRAREAAVSSQRATLSKLGIRFDEWTSETAVLSEGRVTSTLSRLRERGYATERDGALWLRATAFGDSSDRPLVRANGRPTYLAVDIAYHLFKIERGFTRVIDVWTREHAPYFERTQAALRALGADVSRVEVLLCAGARASRDGALVSQGAGGAFTLDEGLQECDSDALRFAMLMRPMSEPLDVDLEFCARDDEANPSYGARLLPARLRMLLEASVSGGVAADVGVVNPGIVSRASQAATPSEPERDLMRLIAVWPDEALSAARKRAPQRIASYLMELVEAAQQLAREGFHADSPERTNILRAAQITSSNALRVLGVTVNTRF